MPFPTGKKLSRQSLYALMAAQLLFCISCYGEDKPGNNLEPGTLKTACSLAPLQKSKAMIELILQDLSTSYTQVGGGGITAIKQSQSNTFVVSIAQEERIDSITYEIAMDEKCTAKIIKKQS